jgi:hypothetical protein
MTDELPKKKRFAVRPLLVASAGVAVIAMGACGTTPTGNLIAPRCADGGGTFDGSGMCVVADAGTPDAGP